MPTLNIPKKKLHKQVTDKVKERNKVYKSSTWQELRQAKIINNPVCQICKEQDKITPAIDIHHIKGVLDTPELAYEYSNLASLCKQCHQLIHNSKSFSAKWSKFLEEQAAISLDKKVEYF